MKKILLTLMLAMSFAWANAQIIVTGEINANTTWTNDNIYILNGWVYVRAGATLTIEPGTIIKGDFVTKGSLIIERDADIIADGTPEQPIVFTSQKAIGQRSYGDWGGLIICGRASVNAPANVTNGTEAGEAIIEGGVGSIYGGGANPDDDDNSGIVRYVRLEYGGIPFQPNSEINGLTMGGVGRGTTIENVMVSFCGDDAFEWFGGTVNCKKLIAYRNWDDDFDSDFGYSGNVQFAMSVRDPSIADQSGSNGFESDNDGSGTGATPITQPKFSNVTIVGPYAFSETINSNYKRALHLRRNTKTSVFNSVFMGYPTGLLIDGSTTQTNASNNELRFKNNFLVQIADSLATTSSANPNNISGGFNISDWFAAMGQNNQLIDAVSSLQLTGINLSAPTLTLGINSPLADAASFDDSYLDNSFFEEVNFAGAFGTENWASCWSSWDPQNEPYNGAIDNAILANVEVIGGGEAMMCVGDDIQMQASSNHPDASYHWSNNTNEATTTITQEGVYNVEVVTPNGCSVMMTNIEVVNFPQPEVTISASGATSFCTGGSVELTSTQPTGNVWSNESALNSIEVNTSGVYWLSYTDDNDCTVVSNSIEVSVSDSPAPTISTSGSTTFCEGETVTLTSSMANSYLWNLNGSPIANQDGVSLVVSEEGVYTVSVTNDDQCMGVGTSAFVFVQVESAPQATFTVDADYGSYIYEFSNNSIGADSYFWDFGNGATSSEINPTFTFANAGSNTVLLTAYNGNCASEFSFTIDDVNIEEMDAISRIACYPNPANNDLNVAMSFSNPTNIQIRVMDLSGRVLVSQNLKQQLNTVHTMNVAQWAQGIYLVECTTGHDTITQKVVVRH